MNPTQGVVVRARKEVARVLEAGRREREAGVQEVARLQRSLRKKWRPCSRSTTHSAAGITARLWILRHYQPGLAPPPRVYARGIMWSLLITGNLRQGLTMSARGHN